ncbi:hypothetical protein GQ600_5119 [Phytophthora cactorum]|nr:hypothetical protein GQ600_5119 [Phytophthora cactorum]
MSSAPNPAPASVGGPWTILSLGPTPPWPNYCKSRCPRLKPLAPVGWPTTRNWTTRTEWIKSSSWTCIRALYCSYCCQLLWSSTWLFGLTALPGFMMLQIYKTAALKRPTKSVERGLGFQLLAVVLGIMALPCHLVVLVYWLGSFTLAVFFGVPEDSTVKRQLGVNTELHRWPKWSWNDTVSGLLGAMDRQGFVKFALKFPSAVVIAPLLKYLFGCNPLLYRLAIRQRCLWTSPLDFNDQKAVAAVVQAASWTLVNLTDLLPQQVSNTAAKR